MVKLIPLARDELKDLEPQLAKHRKSVNDWRKQIRSTVVDRPGKVVLDEWTTNQLKTLNNSRISAEQRAEEVDVSLWLVRTRNYRLTTALEDCLRRCFAALYPELYEQVLHGLPPEMRDLIYRQIAGDSMAHYGASLSNQHLNEYIFSTKAAGQFSLMRQLKTSIAKQRFL